MSQLSDELTKPRWLACQRELIHMLRVSVPRTAKDHPGVWRSQTVDDLLHLADHLEILAEQGICPKITLSWQPTLPGIEEPSAGEVPHFTMADLRKLDRKHNRRKK